MIYILFSILGILLLFLIYIILNHKEEKDCTAWIKRKTKSLTKINYKKMKF